MHERIAILYWRSLARSLASEAGNQAINLLGCVGEPVDWIRMDGRSMQYLLPHDLMTFILPA